jgi:ketosteroid isomerase-like protein
MRRRTLIASLGGLAAMSIASSGAKADAAEIPVRFADALTAHDLERFAALFDEDFVNHQLSAAAPPPVGTPSKKATVAFFAGRLAGLPDLKVSIETGLAAGDKVAASFVYEGTHQGVYFGVQPTGKKLRFTSCDIFRVENGLIVEHWGMGDIAGVMAQLKA